MPPLSSQTLLPGSAAGASGRADLPRWRQLLAPEALQALLNSEGAGECFPDPALLLLEVGEGPWHCGSAPTIPGAAWLDVQQLEGGPWWNRLADGLLLQRFAALGIRHDSSVVLAGRKLVANARVAHLLLYAGVRDVRLLDGGTLAWARAGLPLTRSAPPVRPPATGFGLPAPACPHLMVDMAQVRVLRQHPDATLASIRTRSEFVGRTSGYDHIAARGEIAGARWGHAGDDGDVNDMGAFHSSEGLMLDAGAITALWRSQGIEAQQQVVYCGTGWRASLAFFYAWLMGWERICVYDGGWLEWSSDPLNPVINRQAPATTPAHQPGALQA
jgi:molybdopterin synthase sulfurtransferase